MRMHLRHLPMAGLLAVAGGSAITAASPAVLAYPGPTITIAILAANGCSAVPLGGTCAVTAHVSFSDGTAVAGATVNWTVSVPPGGSVTPNPSTTDSAGNTSVTYHAPTTATSSVSGGGFLASVVHLASVSLCAPGTITATTDAQTTPASTVSASTQVTVVCPGGSSTLLPVTSTGADSSSGGSRLALGTAGLAALLVVVGGVYRLTRTRRQPV